MPCATLSFTPSPTMMLRLAARTTPFATPRTPRHHLPAKTPPAHRAIMSAHQQQQSPPAPDTYADRVVGCFLTALCGDALGAAVEGWSPSQVREAFPNGLTDYQDCRLGRGTYTDDSQMLLALAASLVNNKGVCSAPDVATEYAKAFDPQRGYGGSAKMILAKLQLQLEQGPLPPTLGTELLAQGGSYGNGGAMRVAPLGLVYRNAALPVLEAALRQSLVPTHHTHPWAVEGALTQALAVAYLSKQQPPTQQQQQQEKQPPEGAQQLLSVLQQQLRGRSELMCSRLATMQEGLKKLHTTSAGPKQPHHTWSDYFSSQAWATELSVAAAVAPGEDDCRGFQIKGTDAAAAAIWALVAHWEGGDPADAIVAAVHYGGDTDTIACMTGALVGAAHGSGWLPQHWLSQLETDAQGVAFFGRAAAEAEAAADDAGEDGGAQRVLTTCNMGKDGAVELARLLAELDCKEL